LGGWWVVGVGWGVGGGGVGGVGGVGGGGGGGGGGCGEESKKKKEEKKKGKEEKKKVDDARKHKILMELQQEKGKKDRPDRDPTEKLPEKQIKEVRDELKKEKELIKKKPEEAIGLLDRLTRFFTGVEDKAVTDKSYVPLDKQAKDLIKVSRQELQELRDMENKLTERVKQDKLNAHQYKVFLNKQLATRYNELDKEDKDSKRRSELTQDNVDYLNDQIEATARDKLEFLKEKERIVDTKLMRERSELDEIRNIYIDKLNREFNREYKRMKKQYDTKLKKERHLLLDQIQDYAGDNMFINELVSNLRKQVEIPVMVKSRSIRKDKKDRKDRGGIRTRRKKRKFKRPSEGVYSVMEFLSD